MAVMLKTYCPNVNVVGYADSPLEGIKAIQRLKPQLVFLDIQMPGGTGFDVLEATPDRTFEVIFTTAYDQYALQAIKAETLDYLLKPINISELEEAVSKAERRLKQTEEPPHKEVEATETSDQLALPIQDGYTFVDIERVLRIEGSGNYSTLYFIEGRPLTISKNIKYLEDRLPVDTFFRPHTSHLINLQAIKRYLRTDGGSIEMQDGCVVPLSRRRKEQFQALLKKWL